ncbi:bifunctional P-loop containing nucleoside triphosphate hydrolase/Flagellum site-determining protein YlxH- Fe-S cluster assembling factor NBP35/Mrp-NBP35 ATP-binding protein [Babesia duncani]|uniref:Bifunctional P-loop containing nucleoside triphosphate hydrolase/Flagellum site-determining protein YlxH- Fe-S cluster assembling factor NBP35/Mrp-NBP35 ATP-binding protein n=1 Tax=Babesia duncani TaxID=323732 RepID=A0AAD9UNN4_9APIC|nr:bifunctional P-loop containing nucleoside triphosphate hydrolase/Flagellum site-determining protein YlxH- Fe-S cluster assembling factor NBP35/Mrp-NBP35 ATP-binding protein [Babesia duncani]
MTNKEPVFTLVSLVAFAIVYHYVYQYIHENYFGKDVPQDCPGSDSNLAGKASQCQGCPNQNKCASGEAQKEAEKLQGNVSKSLELVKKVILVMSGKGGVGKSTISTQLAYALEAKGCQVGLLDIDITGPSIPGMTGTVDCEVFESGLGWTPVYANGISLLSVGHLLKDPKSSIVWRGPKKDSLIRQFLTGVCWDALDVLVIDCPPGSSDEHISICNYLREKEPMAIIVTTPQKRAVDDVYRSCHFWFVFFLLEDAFSAMANVKIIALVENMTNSVFDSKSNHCQELCKEFKITNRLEIPMDAKVRFVVITSIQMTTAGEEGVPLSNFEPMQALVKIVMDL